MALAQPRRGSPLFWRVHVCTLRAEAWFLSASQRCCFTVLQEFLAVADGRVVGYHRALKAKQPQIIRLAYVRH